MLGEKSVEGEAHLEDDGGAFVIRFRASDSAVTMSGLVDCDRRDAFTVRNLAQTIGRLLRRKVHACGKSVNQRFVKICCAHGAPQSAVNRGFSTICAFIVRVKFPRLRR